MLDPVEKLRNPITQADAEQPIMGTVTAAQPAPTTPNPQTPETLAQR